MAKKFTIGTIRKWKSGKVIKDAPNHWKILQEITKDKIDTIVEHGNETEAKLAHQAVKKLVMYFKTQGQGTLEKYLNDNYSDKGIERFGAWKKAVLSSVEKYFEHVKALQNDANIKEASSTFTAIQKWRRELGDEFELLDTALQRDALVTEKFNKAGKNIAHLLYAAREIIGRDVSLNDVSDSGFKGLCKAVITKIYQDGPKGLSKGQLETFNKAFDQFFKKTADGTAKYVSLPKALTFVHKKQFFKENPRWFLYCCTRQASKNDGVVDLSTVEDYMKNAMKFHGTDNPPQSDYDDPTGGTRAKIVGAYENPSRKRKDRRENSPIKFKYKKLRRQS